ncbi:hypothetical protein ACH4E8_34245 [Streptomyces sp. NPDC017979]|uniref:ATP-dependent DNA ligase n=1 Tax=Streptomyces sp. NPDC017979 TaxID=3365024 RepID=UPI0037943991
MKWDGFRLLGYATADGRSRLLSRRGTDLTAAFPQVAQALAAVGEDLILDGELVIYDAGRIDFGALQRRWNRTAAVARHLAAEKPPYFVVFDLLQRGSHHLLTEPYRTRRTALEALFAEHVLGPPWMLCPSSTDPAQAWEWMTHWSAIGIEGVMAKGAGQRYQPGRRGWYKIKTTDTTEAIIGAITGTVRRPQTLI